MHFRKGINPKQELQLDWSSKGLTVLSAELLVSIPVGTGGEKFETYLGLIDSGASNSLANDKLATPRSGTKKNTKSTTWQTKTGTFATSKSIVLENMRLPQFTTKRRVDAEFHLFKKLGKDRYNFILGRDFCSNSI